MNTLARSPRRNLNLFSAFFIFALATGYFFLLLYSLYPFLKTHLALNGATYWFITGYFLFIPLFAAAILGAFVEGNRSWGTITKALNVRPMTRSDWYWAVGSLLGLLILTGMVFGLSTASHAVWGTRELNTTPWFMHMEPFVGTDRWLLLLWFPMFFFNIVGEEILWRGYVQTRLPIRLDVQRAYVRRGSSGSARVGDREGQEKLLRYCARVRVIFSTSVVQCSTSVQISTDSGVGSR
jgi:membrane protease YdiL (CAAX protease family)